MGPLEHRGTRSHSGSRTVAAMKRGNHGIQHLLRDESANADDFTSTTEAAKTIASLSKEQQPSEEPTTPEYYNNLKTFKLSAADDDIDSGNESEPYISVSAYSDGQEMQDAQYDNTSQSQLGLEKPKPSLPSLKATLRENRASSSDSSSRPSTRKSSIATNSSISPHLQIPPEDALSQIRPRSRARKHSAVPFNSPSRSAHKRLSPDISSSHERRAKHHRPSLPDIASISLEGQPRDVLMRQEKSSLAEYRVLSRESDELMRRLHNVYSKMVGVQTELKFLTNRKNDLESQRSELEQELARLSTPSDDEN
eukprot:c52798_g1_i1.p1 GENE.c52798_g1_i1~~c52798_g1_i1.p1  ORF type:complete len:310 (+),score=26.41 c52798_g1_i1:1-930(+)